jgi:hypothetical protein
MKIVELDGPLLSKIIGSTQLTVIAQHNIQALEQRGEQRVAVI